MEAITRKSVCIICIALLVALTGTITASMEADEKECADQMVELAACIPYVSGTAKEPSKECCTDTEKLRAAKPKCLCVLIRESTDPSIGLPINTTLALQMPSMCKIDAKISDCPRLLNLAADSPDAKIFKVVDGSADSSSTTTTPSNHSSSSSSSDNTKASSVSANSRLKTSTTGFFFLLMLPMSFVFV